MKLLSSLIGLVILLLALAFAVTNRQPVALNLWPFDLVVQAPLSFLSLGTFLFGLLVGAVFAWFHMIPQRLAARRMRKDFAKLQDKIDDLQQSAMMPEDRDGAFLLSGPARGWRFWRRT
ncbi:MAG: LapA family protein [Alphaproteobacteria bacterium]|nr:LapA family protein [Alphaproteobacteria bacterium]